MFIVYRVKEEHHQVRREYERMPKVEEVEEKKHALRRDIDELKEEIDQVC